LTTPGTKPFGGVVVKDGEIVGEGLNHSLEHFDPTSHGEVEAFRDACRRSRARLGRRHRRGMSRGAGPRPGFEKGDVIRLVCAARR
jgi:tRNA(Arg) A34 adenosine deaminase TadA